MAVRLPIVVSSCANRSSTESNYEENLITELLFADGLDATIIGGLEGISRESTDELCLHGFKGDFAILSWLNENTVASELARLGLVGNLFVQNETPQRRVAFGKPMGDSHSISPEKRIYYFLLQTDKPFKQQVVELKELLKALATPTVQIQFSPSKNGAQKKALPIVATPEIHQTIKAHSTIPTANYQNLSPADLSKPPKAPSPVLESKRSDALMKHDDEFQNIDLLFDEFDESEI